MHWDAATARTPLTTSPQKQKRKKKQPKNQVNLALSPSLSLSLCVALVAHSHSMEESSSSSSPWPMHARQVSQERRLSASQLRCGGVSHTRVLHAVLSRGGPVGHPPACDGATGPPTCTTHVTLRVSKSPPFSFMKTTSCNTKKQTPIKNCHLSLIFKVQK